MSKKKYCMGCGILLQNENITQEGYVTNLESNLCQRCFRMKNYGDYQVVAKSNEEFIQILKSVGKTKDLVLHIVDLFNIDRDLSAIRKYLSNKMILVLNKRDALPKSVREDKIIEYIHSLGLPYEDVVIISANKNYQIDLLMKKIKKLKTSNRIYVVGHTNTGKSSLINQIIKNYSDLNQELTISPLPCTTLNTIEIPLDQKITLIDTPGLVDRGNIANYVDHSFIKKLVPKKEIKPKTYQIRKGQCLVVDKILRIDYIEGERNSFTFYLPNGFKVKKMNAIKQKILKDLSKTSYELKYREDLVVNGLGWIKIVEKCKIDLYIDKNIETFTRRSLI